LSLIKLAGSYLALGGLLLFPLLFSCLLIPFNLLVISVIVWVPVGVLLGELTLGIGLGI
jgi:hypothetical protein